MNAEQIYPPLTEIFNEVFFTDDFVLKPEMSAETVEGWDSYKHVELLFATEEKFDIKFKSSEIEKLNCVGDLVAIIAAKTGG